jgi:acyl-CoA dehydrogenase
VLVRADRAERGFDVVRDPDDGRPTRREYVINGSKMFISNAGHAAWIVVFASTTRARVIAGCPRSSSRPTPRASPSKAPGQDGPAATDTSALAFQDVKVPPRTGSARRATASRSRCGRSTTRGPGRRSGAVGVARAAYELSVEYSRERVQFGQPIAMNQGVTS